MEEIIDLTSENPETYNSESIRRFTWWEDPQGPQGLLFVEFETSSSYVYYGVPKSIYIGMKELSERGLQDVVEEAQTTGEFFQQNVVSVYDTHHEDYNTFDELLENHESDSN